MSTLRRWIANALMAILPMTRMYASKRVLWRWAGVQVGANVRIVSSVRIWTTGPVDIGDETFIGHEVMIVGGRAPVKIGARCDLAPRVTIATGTHDEGTPERAAGDGRSEPITIGDGVWIGTSSTLIAGAGVGASSIVGAGSLVRDYIPERSVAAGVPCRVKRPLREDPDT